MASAPFSMIHQHQSNIHHNHEERVAMTVISVIAALCMSLLLVIGVYYLYTKRIKLDATEKQVHPKAQKDKDQQSSQFSQDLQKSSASQYIIPAMHVAPAEAQVFTFKQLQAATSNFSSANVIGHGGFGFVYKGTLRDGRVAAIKQLDRASKQGDHEFRVEVDLLSRLHSPYLLELIGYCADQENRLLVYEFMSNGNLQEHLYSDGAHGNPAILDWSTRLRIALDAARGLEYLHDLNNPPIIHRDFKTSNILLDDNYNARVSDFGLARLGSDKMDGQVSTRVLGTHGYLAPEYALTGHLTIKSDVYSFGVVLLELLTRRVPVDMKRPPGEGILVSWALPRLTDKEELEAMVDPVLKGQYTVKELVQVAAIAKMCVQSEADYRPLMTDVVQSLTPLVKKYGNRSHSLNASSQQHHIVTFKSSLENARAGYGGLEPKQTQLKHLI